MKIKNIEGKLLIVVLVNGNINRIRAMISGMIMADQLKRLVKFVWPHEYICKDDFNELFDAEFVTQYFISDSDITLNSFSELGEGWHVIDEETILLRGGTRGEQYYLNNKIVEKINIEKYKKIVIISGDIYQFPTKDKINENKFSKIRYAAYSNLLIHPEINKQVKYHIEQINEKYIGVHLRYTDLLANAPSTYQVSKKIIEICNDLGMNSVFIASDNSRKRKNLIKILEKYGISCYFQRNEIKPRGTPGSNAEALIDWLMLGESSKLIYFGSTFGSEAMTRAARDGDTIILKSSILRKYFLSVFQIIYRIRRKIISKSNQIIHNKFQKIK